MSNIFNRLVSRFLELPISYRFGTCFSSLLLLGAACNSASDKKPPAKASTAVVNPAESDADTSSVMFKFDRPPIDATKVNRPVLHNINR